ncbi:major facilitator superfamily protein [Xylariaceae sp. FL0255]|nr:major facilitator superfamily protein [Xylariaceae sp. FL0255]
MQDPDPTPEVATDTDQGPNTQDTVTSVNDKTDDASFALNKDPRFWAIIVAISFAALLTALESTITSTALPTIIADLGGGDLYIWAINGYLVALTSLQPLYGQLANVYGRRWPTIIATASFVLGSGICGGAKNIGQLIAGRVIQGIGAGGINVLVEIITCDLVPLRYRGNYLAIIFGLISLGTALGPFFGGLIVSNITWRWVFYLCLPVGGTALILLIFFLHVNHNKERGLANGLANIDWLGNLLFTASVTSVLVALAWAGVVYPWSSYQVLVPLILGFAGIIGFLFFEGSPFVPQAQTIPLRLFSNRTSTIAFVLTFLHSISGTWTLYFLPVYFQGARGYDPTYSGVALLPTILILIPFAITGGGIMSKFGIYKSIHYIGFGLLIIGFGTLTLLNENSPTGQWVGFQIISAAGAGIIIPTLLPAVMASLSDSDTAVATATWSFLRSFGLTWGAAVPAAVFNSRFDQLAPRYITNQVLKQMVTGGQAYSHATSAFLNSLDPTSRQEFILTVIGALKETWQVAIAFSGLGFLLVNLEKSIKLRDKLDTDFGIKERSSRSDTEAQNMSINTASF